MKKPKSVSSLVDRVLMSRAHNKVLVEAEAQVRNSAWWMVGVVVKDRIWIHRYYIEESIEKDLLKKGRI